jgi:hypothetical protein
MPITPETKNQLRPLPEMPCIFSFRLQCGGEGAPCGRGQGSHGWSANEPAKTDNKVNMRMTLLIRTEPIYGPTGGTAKNTRPTWKSLTME